MSNKQFEINLKDGRRLTYCDQGNPQGKVVLLLHGTPGHSLFWNQLPGFTEACENYRFISVDRRGYGTSDYKSDNTFLNYVDDIEELLSYLQIDKVTILGVSGGGPYTLACGYKIPDKVDQLVVVSSAGPSNVGSITEAISSTNRIVYKIARRFPWLMNLNMRLLISWQRKSPVKFIQKMAYKLSGPDQDAIKRAEVQAIMKDIYLNSYKKTWKGYARDVILQANDWGFDLRQIQPRVIIFQANDDTSSPPAVGEYFSQIIPNNQLYCYDNAGHLWQLLHLSEILSKI
ncbi:MAG: alpha/beta hydrolase [Spirochaetes bacterium]|nr:alpha/beta hydrolase [Spirochaetota bacterium]